MITVWGRRSSINVQKVLWALTEVGQEFERHTVGGSFGGTDTKEYKKLNPLGLVPAIEDGTIKMFESNAIIRYLARRYGAGTLRPRGQKANALAEQWTEFAAHAVMQPLTAVFLNNVRVPAEQRDAAAVKAGEAQLAQVLKHANRMLGRKPYVAGRHFSFGDIPIAAAYWRYQNLEIKRPNLPNLDRHFESMKERAGYQEYVMVPIGSNLEEWSRNEADLK